MNNPKRTPLTMKEFGELFRLLVEVSDYEIREVCEYAGLSPSYPSRWRRGETLGPNFQQIGLIADKLKVPVENLIFGWGDTVTISREQYDELKHKEHSLLYSIAQRKAQEDKSKDIHERKN